MIKLDIDTLNKELRNKTPDQIIEWALTLSSNRIVTTSFGKYSAILLSTMSKHDKDIKVVWCDTLFNLPETYAHAENLIKEYHLNIKKYQSLKTREEIEETIGLPSIEDDNHAVFSEVVKLEPFRRALQEQQPDLWFTNIRVRQTELRDKKDILSYSKDGILKISPFYYWSDYDLDNYLEVHHLPKNHTYFDPIKALENRECGIHLQ
ncbi:phosphoadenosine phosphosulfate reductase family protein [Lacinutrix sp. C3R15]|uniref:phosphoadenosine phosphosulfate reductase domain-containing protein n=1 Tax=Flavobacteriaceae TaxID=49546 RepID=UPI001C08B41B|nr:MULTISPECIES: phosphoadenosine phosphosulfate reductase family protein [Flavobacteriaceae]MBU2939937.1 phosphoadenosine phosphosulfate reductase family protein [Lacinutrix sp. C3R15]MDO6623254.1 phosphoadenosine phosphosulfate reductase family protein [Oceanihabitans sp. 1_MG-2023]